MNYVYLVYADNGEEDGYDYDDWLVSVHDTEDGAREFIKENALPKVKDAKFIDIPKDFESFGAETIAFYRSPKETSIYSEDWFRGCNACWCIVKRVLHT